MYECHLLEKPTQPVLSIRTRTPVGNLPQVLGSAYAALERYLGEIGERPAGPPFVAYYNMDMQDLDIAVGFPVPRRLPGRDEIQPDQIPGGKQVTCLHVGPYHKVEAAYQALTAWIGQHGQTPTGVAYEFYLNDPGETPETELQTLVLFPLQH